MINKLKFAVYANCQGSGIAKTLLENKEFSEKYEFCTVKPIQNLKQAHYNSVVSIIKEVDLFIYQPIQETKNRPAILSSGHMIKQLKPGANIISVPSLYFDGYFPHLQSLNQISSVLNKVHDYFIAYAYAKGKTQQETLEILQSETLYPKRVSENLFQRSLKNLNQREQQENINIKVSNFIEENYRNEKLFFQFNHPSRVLLKFVATSILKQLGIEDCAIPDEGEEHLNAISTPVYLSSYKNLELGFKEDHRTYKTKEMGVVDQAKVVEGFFDAYRSQDKQFLVDHIQSKKPFIARLMQAQI